MLSLESIKASVSGLWASTLSSPRNVGVGSAVAVVGLTSIFAIRKWAAGGKCTTLDGFSGKTVLITGANGGIGKETAQALAAHNNTVILACRDLERGEAAAAAIKQTVPDARLEVLQLDLSSMTSIRAFVKNLSLKDQKIDVLVNNAGVMMIPKRETTADNFEMQVGTNHLGHFLLTNLILKEKILEKGRIVTVASRVHERTAKGENLDDLLSEKSYGPQDAYAKSKLSNVLFTRELARRLKEQGNDKITAVSLHPGVVRTELFKYVPGAFLMKWFPPIQFLGWLIMKSPVEGAQTSLHCITAPSVDRSSGEYFSDCAVATSSAQGRDMELAKKLWDKSEKLVGL